MSKVNIKIIGLIFFISLVLIFGGNYLLKSYRFNYSLQTNLLELDYVKELNVEEVAGYYKLELTLNEVNNFKQIYAEINNLLKDNVDKDYRLIFNPETYDSFEDEYRKLSFSLYEVLETGEFSLLPKRSAKYSEQYQLDELEFEIDDDYIYLSMRKDKQNFYKVIERRKEDEKNG